MDAMMVGDPGRPPAGKGPGGEPPLVVALPAEEAVGLLRRAGWTEVEVLSTRAPRRGAAPGADEAGGAGEAGEIFVVRQRRRDGVVSLTVAAHPGGPWKARPPEEATAHG